MLQILSMIALMLTQAEAEGLSPRRLPPLEELPERIEQLLSDPKIPMLCLSPRGWVEGKRTFRQSRK